MGGAHETVLVVEDEPMVRMLVVDYLNDLGYVTVEAKDAPSALAVLATDDPIHLLLTDIGLPGMNGRDLADEARRIRPAMKVIFATGYGSADMASDSMSEGTDLVGKPFDMDELGAKVRAMIDRA